VLITSNNNIPGKEERQGVQWSVCKQRRIHGAAVGDVNDDDDEEQPGGGGGADAVHGVGAQDADARPDQVRKGKHCTYLLYVDHAAAYAFSLSVPCTIIIYIDHGGVFVCCDSKIYRSFTSKVQWALLDHYYCP